MTAGGRTRPRRLSPASFSSNSFTDRPPPPHPPSELPPPPSAADRWYGLPRAARSLTVAGSGKKEGGVARWVARSPGSSTVRSDLSLCRGRRRPTPAAPPETGRRRASPNGAHIKVHAGGFWRVHGGPWEIYRLRVISVN